MTQSYEKILNVVKDGNKNLLYFLFIFIFIHFVIIIPYKHPIENNSIGQASKTIENQISYLTSSLAKLENKNESGKLISPDSETNYPENSLYTRDSMKQEQIYSLREKLIQYQKTYIDILKQRAERSFNIPILGITINEGIILSIYPGFILVGLCLSLIYRKRLLSLIIHLQADERKDFSFPIWAAPLPYSLKYNSFSSWLFVNTIGLSVHCLIIYVGLDFLLFRGNKFDFEVLAINVFIAAIATIVYFTTIIQLITFEWKRTEK